MISLSGTQSVNKNVIIKENGDVSMKLNLYFNLADIETKDLLKDNDLTNKVKKPFYLEILKKKRNK